MVESSGGQRSSKAEQLSITRLYFGLYADDDCSLLVRGASGTAAVPSHHFTQTGSGYPGSVPRASHRGSVYNMLTPYGADAASGHWSTRLPPSLPPGP